MIVFILLALLLVIFISWLSFIKDFKRCNVKGPLVAPLVGNLPLCYLGLEDIFGYLHDLRENFGNAIQLYILSNRYIILYHPKYFEPVLSSTELITKGVSYNYLRPWLGNGLLTSTGQKWKLQRKFLTPAFHFNILQMFLPTFLRNTGILIDKMKKLANGQHEINLFSVIALVALDNVTETIMGVAVHAQEDTESEYVKAIKVASNIAIRQMLNPLFGTDIIFRLTPYKKQRDDALKTLHKHTSEVINMRIKELKEKNITIDSLDKQPGYMNKNAFLDLLLLSEIDGETMDLESVREQVDTFLFAGHDTTTSAIVYTLYCISQYEHVQKKLLEEQMTILGEDLNREPNYNELKLMKYLEAVIKETLRLYPSVPLIERRVEDDTDLLGSHIPKGSSVILNIFEMQRHPDVYENPLEFKTDRFDQKKSPYSWVAFSAGPRNCIGQKFAMMEIKTIIGSIVRNFKILPVDGAMILQPMLILRSKNTVSIKLLPRKLDIK